MNNRSHTSARLERTPAGLIALIGSALVALARPAPKIRTPQTPGLSIVRQGALTLLIGGLLAGLSPQPIAAPLSSRDEATVQAAIAAGAGGDWGRALTLSANTEDAAAGKLLRWLYLLKADTGPSFEAVSRFVIENPAWPGLRGLRARAESTVTDMVDGDAVRAWFKRFPPLTAAGMIRYHEAVAATPEQPAVTERARGFWIAEDLSEREQTLFLERLGSVLRPADHTARLNRLLWEGENEAARRMLPLVDENQRALALARLALAGGEQNDEAVLSRVPANLREDQGLVYERVRTRRKADQTDAAIALLNSVAGPLQFPDRWWNERQNLVRRLISERLYAAAYRLAAAHRQADGQGYAQAEFLAGWLALTQLKRPRQAFSHFQKLYAKVSTPLSLARGAYWSGRAAEADGNAELARRWYRTAAGFPTTFYGQLAADGLGLSRQEWLPAPVPISAAATHRFDDKELVRVVRLLDRVGSAERRPLLTQFLAALAGDSKSAEEFALAAGLAEATGMVESAVTIAKKAQAAGHPALIPAGYPVAGVPAEGNAEPPYILALIRQESQFNAEAVSRAGARGLMQLMPATARAVSKDAGLAYSQARLTDDPAYNIRLGTSYLSRMLERFEGSKILAAAAYNAGPGRAAKWVQTLGDPRQMTLPEVIDWIEQIPISETRDYVQRVLEGTQVYRARLNPAGGVNGIARDLAR